MIWSFIAGTAAGLVSAVFILAGFVRWANGARRVGGANSREPVKENVVVIVKGN